MKRYDTLALLLISMLMVIMLTGCASTIEGVAVTEEERAECASSKDCEVWTPSQLTDLIRRSFTEGFIRGRASSRTKDI